MEDVTVNSGGKLRGKTGGRRIFALAVDFTMGFWFQVSSSMLRMWTDFARVGNPTPQDNSWQKVDSDNVQYLEISSSGNFMDFTEEYRAGNEEWKGMWERNPISMGNTTTWSQRCETKSDFHK